MLSRLEEMPTASTFRGITWWNSAKVHSATPNTSTSIVTTTHTGSGRLRSWRFSQSSRPDFARRTGAFLYPDAFLCAGALLRRTGCVLLCVILPHLPLDGFPR